MDELQKDDVRIIPKNITEDEKKIREILSDPNVIGVMRIRKRRCGNQMLHQLIFNTEEAEVLPQPQLPPSNSNQ